MYISSVGIYYIIFAKWCCETFTVRWRFISDMCAYHF